LKHLENLYNEAICYIGVAKA